MDRILVFVSLCGSEAAGPVRVSYPSFFALSIQGGSIPADIIPGSGNRSVRRKSPHQFRHPLESGPSSIGPLKIHKSPAAYYLNKKSMAIVSME
jgi:hypothetical protein